MIVARCMRRPIHLYGRWLLNLLKIGRGTAIGLNCQKEKTPLLSIKRNKEQTRHVIVGTINFLLTLVATRNLVELVRSRRGLGRVSDTPLEGPSLSMADEREGSCWNKNWISC